MDVNSVYSFLLKNHQHGLVGGQVDRGVPEFPQTKGSNHRKTNGDRAAI